MSRADTHLSRIGNVLSQNLGDGVREPAQAALPAPEGEIPVAIPITDPDDRGQRARGFWVLRVEDIQPDPLQPRQEFEEESLERLGQDIARRGLLQPIRVRKNKDGKYTIIAGERRWRAAKAAKVHELPCQIVEHVMSDGDILEEQLVENIQREQLTDPEKAWGYSQLIKKNGWTQASLAQALGLSTASVSRTLTLLELPDQVRQHVSEGRLASSVAYELTKLGNAEMQTQLAEEAVARKLSRDDVQQQVGRRENKPPRIGHRLTLRLEGGTSLTLSNNAQALTTDHVIETLSQVLGKARKLRSRNQPIDQLPGLLKAAAKDKGEEPPAAESTPPE